MKAKRKPYDVRTLRYVARALDAEAQRVNSGNSSWLQGYRSAEAQHAVNFRNLAKAIVESNPPTKRGRNRK